MGLPVDREGRVAICNRALLGIGANPIKGFAEEQSTEARIASEFYEPAVLFCLSSYNWTFATRSRLLGESGKVDASSTPYQYGYALPNDFIRAIEVVYSCSRNRHNYLPNPPSLFEIRGSNIYTDYPEKDYLKYLCRAAEQEFSQDFTESLVAYLKYKFAMPLTNDMQMEGMKFREYQEFLKKAQLADSVNRTNHSTQDTFGPVLGAFYNR